MKKYESIEHYTLVEYLALLTGNDGKLLPSKWAFASSNSLATLINNYVVTNSAERTQFASATSFTQYGSPTVTLNPYVEQLWSKLLAKFATWIIYEKETDEESSDFELSEPLCEIISVLDDTYDKYATILTYYTSQKDNLMKGGSRDYTRNTDRDTAGAATNSAMGIDKTKDTPQSSISPESDAYNSEVRYTSGNNTQATNLDESIDESYTENFVNDNVMSRLSDITNKIVNVWETWLNEFNKLFVCPLNIER